MLRNNKYSFIAIAFLLMLNVGIYSFIIRSFLASKQSDIANQEISLDEVEQKGLNISLDQYSRRFLNNYPSLLETRLYIIDPSDENHYYLKSFLEGDEDSMLYKIDAYGDKNNLEKVIFTGYHFEESGNYILDLVDYAYAFLNITTTHDDDEENWLAKLFGSTVFEYRNSQEFPRYKVFELNNKKITFKYFKPVQVGNTVLEITVEYSPVSLTLQEYINITVARLAPSVDLIEQASPETDVFKKKLNTKGLGKADTKQVGLYIKGKFRDKNTQEVTERSIANIYNIKKVDSKWDTSNLHGDSQDEVIVHDLNGEFEISIDLTFFKNMNIYLKDPPLEEIEVQIYDGTEGSELFGMPLVTKTFTITEISE